MIYPYCTLGTVVLVIVW